jgi:hypothetical protein
MSFTTPGIAGGASAHWSGRIRLHPSLRNETRAISRRIKQRDGLWMPDGSGRRALTGAGSEA